MGLGNSQTWIPRILRRPRPQHIVNKVIMVVADQQAWKLQHWDVKQAFSENMCDEGPCLGMYSIRTSWVERKRVFECGVRLILYIRKVSARKARFPSHD